MTTGTLTDSGFPGVSISSDRCIAAQYNQAQLSYPESYVCSMNGYVAAFAPSVALQFARPASQMPVQHLVAQATVQPVQAVTPVVSPTVQTVAASAATNQIPAAVMSAPVTASGGWEPWAPHATHSTGLDSLKIFATGSMIHGIPNWVLIAAAFVTLWYLGRTR